MNCTKWLEYFLFVHLRGGDVDRAEGPSGSALYSYRCTEKTYQELSAIIRDSIRAAVMARGSLGFEACFCMYAAETFRREHSGGPWAWKTVFDPLHIEPPANQILGRWVEQGLKYWKRKVMAGEGGQRLSLVTIACEGGLPLRLLEREGAHLRNYFRRILEKFHGNQLPLATIKLLAHEYLPYLPKTLRNPEVAQLAADLITRTVQLQQEIGDVEDPLTALDSKLPNWRSTLPLRMEDNLAAALFKNLFEQSQQLAKQASVRAAWIGSLCEEGPGQFVVRKVLQFPERITFEQLSDWVGGVQADVPRWHLMLEVQRRNEPVAWLTQVMNALGDRLYRREWLRRDAVRLSGNQLLEPHSISISDGHITCPLTFQNGDIWGESPWVFVPSRDANNWQWLGEGSVRIPHSVARVAVAERTQPVLADGVNCTLIGVTAEPPRKLYEIHGEVDFLTEDGDRYRLSCNAQSAGEATLELRGKVLPQAYTMRPMFLSAPRFFEVAPNGAGAPAAGEMQWRAFGSGGAWRPLHSDCVGRVWLRLVDPSTKIERIRRMADVLPSRFAIQGTIGVAQQPGSYLLTNVNGAEVRASSSVSHTVMVSPEKVCIECPTLASAALEPVRITLAWPNACPLEMEQPYPQQGAGFQLDGRILAQGELVTVDRLYGLWLQIQAPDSSSRFSLDAELIHGIDSESSTRLGFNESLSFLQKGSLQFSLGSLVDRIKSLLAADDAMDTCVRLSVRARGRELVHVRVAYYDMNLVPLWAFGTVCLPIEQLQKLGDDWSSRVALEMFPLTNPDASPRLLSPCSDDTATWQIPDGLEPGPWWVVGRDGRWARFRPFLWPIAREEMVREEADSEVVGQDAPLAAAVRESDRTKRARQIDEALEMLGTVPDHPEWERLMGYVRLAAEFPPNSIDVLRHLIRHPQALVMALLRADDQMYVRLIEMAEQMPFAWGLLPVTAWQEAARRYWEHLRSSLQGIEGVDDLTWQVFESFRARAIQGRPFFSVLCEHLQEQLFPERPLKQSELQLIRKLGPSFTKEFIASSEQELLSRHGGDEMWAVAPELLEAIDANQFDIAFTYRHLGPITRAVRCAPFVAADISLRGLPVSADLVFRLRALRAFDIQWFDRIYMVALTLGLAELEKEVVA